MKKALMIAFHYPPFSGSSSVHRIVSFAQHLPTHGWEPIILTANARAYPPKSISPDHRDAPSRIVVRAPALDVARHLSLGGRYVRWMALPDRWSSWFFGALLRGMRLAREHRPDVLWSTFPIATAHLLGLSLHRLTGIPWIADFRDSMTEDEYPEDPTARRAHRWIERRVVSQSRFSVFTTPGAKRMYAQRYPALTERRWKVIANGFDDSSFAEAEKLRSSRSDPRDRVVLVHSGLLYRSERDPQPFFDAVRELRCSGKVNAANLRIILRASGDEAYYRHHLRQRQIEDIVHLAEPLPYFRSLAEMLDADGLLIFQASNCNHQIPAKVYEYMRTRRPILALTDPRGDTAAVLRKARTGRIVRLDSSGDIAESLTDFIADIRTGRAPIADDAEIRSHSRAERTRELADLLNRIGE